MPGPPPDTDPGSLDATDAHARRVSTPPAVMPPRLPSAPARQPSGRREAVSDRALTERVARIEPDPAPLPPSPAAEQASRWLERERPRFEAPTEIAESSDTTRPLTTHATPGAHVGHSTAFTALLAVTMLVVGMVVGALLFGR
jgi:hypothetical protein